MTTITMTHNNSCLPKNVKIENIETLPESTVNKLIEARDVIGNYAKSKNASVRFFDSRTMFDSFNYEKNSRDYTSQLAIEVRQKNRPRSQVKYVEFSEKSGKSFLRNIYENLQELCGEQSPIAEHVKNTRERLADALKISRRQMYKLTLTDFISKTGKTLAKL